MFEQLVSERAEIEQLQPGDQLLEYLQGKFGWEFRKTIAKDIPTIAPACEEVFVRPSTARDDLDALIFQLNERFFIKDTFDKDHGARREFFRHVLGKNGSWLKKHSKLSGNNWNNSFFMIEEILEKLRRNNIKISFDMQRVLDVARDAYIYRELDFDGKVAYVERIDGLIQELLAALSDASLEDDE